MVIDDDDLPVEVWQFGAQFNIENLAKLSRKCSAYYDLNFLFEIKLSSLQEFKNFIAADDDLYIYGNDALDVGKTDEVNGNLELDDDLEVNDDISLDT